MAGLDYVKCNECGKRLFYDGEYRVRDSMEDNIEVKFLVCDKCVLKLKKKIETLKKHDRRRH